MENYVMRQMLAAAEQTTSAMGQAMGQVIQNANDLFSQAIGTSGTSRRSLQPSGNPNDGPYAAARNRGNRQGERPNPVVIHMRQPDPPPVLVPTGGPPQPPAPPGGAQMQPPLAVRPAVVTRPTEAPPQEAPIATPQAVVQPQTRPRTQSRQPSEQASKRDKKADAPETATAPPPRPAAQTRARTEGRSPSAQASKRDKKGEAPEVVATTPSQPPQPPPPPPVAQRAQEARTRPLSATRAQTPDAERREKRAKAAELRFELTPTRPAPTRTASTPVERREKRAKAAESRVEPVVVPVEPPPQRGRPTSKKRDGSVAPESTARSSSQKYDHQETPIPHENARAKNMAAAKATAQKAQQEAEAAKAKAASASEARRGTIRAKSQEASRRQESIETQRFPSQEPIAVTEEKRRGRQPNTTLWERSMATRPKEPKEPKPKRQKKDGAIVLPQRSSKKGGVPFTGPITQHAIMESLRIPNPRDDDEPLTPEQIAQLMRSASASASARKRSASSKSGIDPRIVEQLAAMDEDTRQKFFAELQGRKATDKPPAKRQQVRAQSRPRAKSLPQVQAVPDPATAIVGRGRGRPRKNPVDSTGNKEIKGKTKRPHQEDQGQGVHRHDRPGDGLLRCHQRRAHDEAPKKNQPIV